MATGNGGRVQPGHGEETADHLVQAFEVLFHVIEGGVVALSPAREIKRYIQSGQRRSKLVGDVIDELALSRDKLLDALCHGIEVLYQQSEFIAAALHARGGAGT